MTEIKSSPPKLTVSTIPAKRPFIPEDKHAPVVGSPLNPNPTGRVREERTKKPTAKARKEPSEASPSSASKKAQANNGTSSNSKGGGGSNPNKSSEVAEILRPTRYRIPPPNAKDFESPPPPIFQPSLVRKDVQFHEVTEIIPNRKGFRYTNAVADPRFVGMQYYRQSEAPPYQARVSFEDASAQLLFSRDGQAVTTDQGFRMARANVGAREGRWYYECKVLSGIRKPTGEDDIESDGGGHVRIGWARREASLESPVGFDACSYGIRDVSGQKITRSRPTNFAEADLCEGDVIGLELTLPSLSLHRKIVDGIYNKAVDVSDDLDPAAAMEAPDIIRDRVSCHYRTRLYFEAFEYQVSKPLEDYTNPSSSTASSAIAQDNSLPHPNHPVPSLRTLPLSSIKIYKNGELLGTPFTDLLAFLPPASKPTAQGGAREGLDDGGLGYFPAVSVFRGGAVQTNFGPDFEYPPTGITEYLQSKTRSETGATSGTSLKNEDIEMQDTADSSIMPATPVLGTKAPLRPISERFEEQIAEDIVYDLIDEVDFCSLDGGTSEVAIQSLDASNGGENDGLGARPDDRTAANGDGDEEGKVMVMEGRRAVQIQVPLSSGDLR